MRYGAIVIGAGPAGCHASLEAARLGLDVLLVDPAAEPGAGSGIPGMLTAGLLRGAARGARPTQPELLARSLARQRGLLAQELRESRTASRRGGRPVRTRPRRAAAFR